MLAAFVLASLTLASSASTAGAGVSGEPPGERIVAGTAAVPAAWPWIGALYIKSINPGGKEIFACGATVIAPRVALTAAHCVENLGSRDLALVVGRSNLSEKSTGQRIPLRSVETDPRYGQGRYNFDVAVLTLRRAVTVPPVALASVAESDAATAVGMPLRTAGWGSTNPSGVGISRRLMSTSETVREASRCKRAHAFFDAVTTICSQGARPLSPRKGHTGICYGDSGGPVVADTPTGPLLVGAVSGVVGLRCGTTADYHARISAFLPFIERQSGVVPPAP